VRFKILVIAGAAILLVIAAPLLFRNERRTATNNPDDTNAAPVSLPVSRSEPANKRTVSKVELPISVPALTTNQVLEKLSAVEELAVRNDPAALKELLVTLSDSNPKIRRAALDAVIQVGDRAAIPTLKALAAKTEDAREKTALLDAVEFLEMPSLSEIRARTNSSAISGGQK
jgi:hypothetical protein